MSGIDYSPPPPGAGSSKLRSTEPSPYDASGFFNVLSFGWVSPLLTKGIKTGIDEDDGRHYLPKSIESVDLAARFDAQYSMAAARIRARGGRPGQGGALWSCVCRLFIGDYVYQCFWMCVEMGIRLVAPFLMREFLRWIQNRGSRAGLDWWGWVLATLLAATAYGMMVAHHQLFFSGMTVGFRLRVQVMAAVHSKVLRMTRSAIQNLSTGHVVNLVSNDVRRFDDASPFWPFIFFGPCELGLVLLMIALELGIVPAIVGVTTLLLIIPIQALLVRYMGSLRETTARHTDDRVRLTNELIHGSLALKMYAWEEPMFTQLSAIRAKEAAALGKRAMINALNFAANYAITPVCCFATFAVARAIGKTLTVPSVFYVVGLLVLPKLWMGTFFVRAVETLTELRVSIHRLDRFLSQPEQDLFGGEDESAGPGLGAPVVILKGDFDWKALPPGSAPHDAVSDSKDKKSGKASHAPSPSPGSLSTASTLPTLRNMDFEVRKGQLVAIVGLVGAGKSSVLSALLGEILPATSTEAGRAAVARVKGSVAYAGQVPWIMGGTVMDNILFGRPYDEKRYQRVLASCSLNEDISQLAAGDQTELGERGINLSGGQKARVALARAAYSAAAVQLLDDPLSAVDARVGRVLFEDCIRGVMSDSTRVLITHQRQYLPDCDRIVVMRGGEIVHDGTFEELRAAGVAEVLPVEDDSDAKKGKSKSLPSAKDLRSLTMDDLGDIPEDEDAGLGSREASAAGTRTPAAKLANGNGNGAMGSREGSRNANGGVMSAYAGNGNVAGSAGAGRKLTRPQSIRRALSRMLRTGGPQDDSGGAADGSEMSKLPSGETGAHVGNHDPATGGLAESAADAEAAAESAARGQLTAKEGKATGGVSGKVYLEYGYHMGTWTSIFIIVTLILGQGVEMTQSIWLAKWARASPSDQKRDDYWILIYGLLTLGVIILSTLRSVAFFAASLKSATKINNLMTWRVLRAPLSFFHTTPTGRILNRFSKDQALVDELLPMTMFDALQCGGVVLACIIYASISVPFIVPILLPLTLVFIYIRHRYVVTSREVKRFEAVTRSPIYADFSSTLVGLPTIRAFRAGSRFRGVFMEGMDDNSSWWFLFIATSRWIGFRLDLISAVLLHSFTYLILAIKKDLNPALAALALSQVLTLSGLMQWCVRQTAELENVMTSTERLLDYTRLPLDHPRVADDSKALAAPQGWPATGKIEFQKVTATYRLGLPPVLTGVSFTVQPGQSCGIVGRTGSGKSTTLLALFRLIDLDPSGRILLDGLDIASVGSDALRRALAIIPQDPVLFSGTVRSNLDPWGSFTDVRLNEVLDLVQLKGGVSSAGGLDSTMTEGGTSFSVGQRQLLCLARALLQDARVLCMDEATANVDSATDQLIQRALKDVMGSGNRTRTLLVIAHRLDTIVESDTLVVLNKGSVVETGSPSFLMEKAGGAFNRMLSAARKSQAAQL